MKAEFAPSLMCMDFLNIKEQMEILNKRIDMYHCDIMDGHFCKNITLSPDLIKTFGTLTDLPMDVHLMTTNPTDWIELLAKAGAEYISPHAETINTDAFRVMNLIESLGCKKGVVLNPATPLSYIKHYLNRIDMLTIMTVDVGFAGQPFIAEMLDKIREAAELREKYGYSYKIQIDGSCNVNTFKRLREAGADVFVVGSSGLFKNDPDLNKACDIMYENFEKETGEAVYR
ncbi:MAG: D-allulose 6-phosphate 3-epimerase [Candidatus Avilachnospira sp.]